MKSFILILILLHFVNCNSKKEQRKICIPYKTELYISFGEKVSSIKGKFKLLEKAYFDSGDTLVYLDVDRFEINGRSIKSTLYFYFYKNRLNKINSLYELGRDDSLSLKWLKEEIMKCSILKEKQNESGIWEYNDEINFIRLSVSFDKLNDSIQRCWYLIEQRSGLR